MEQDILNKLLDLYKQATTESSHYYTANIIKESINEIIILRGKVSFLEDVYEDHLKCLKK